jgi:putative ABC transport system permease protein
MPSRSWTTGWDPVWTRAPFVLLRYPGLLAALAAGALLLSLTAAAFPLFVSASGARILRAEIGASLIGRYGAGITYEVSSLFFDRPFAGRGLPIPARTDVLADLASDSPYLAPVERSLLGPSVSVNDPDHPRRIRPARLFTGAEAVDHVDVLEGRDGSGVWIPDVVARGLRVGAGDRIRLSSGDHDPVILPVDGVYRSLTSQPPGGYWLAWESEIYPTSCTVDCALPPQPILVDEDRFLELSREDGLGDGTVAGAWTAPIRKNLTMTLDDARGLSRFSASVRETITDRNTEAGRILDCCQGGSPFGTRTEYRSSIDHVIDQTVLRTISLESPSRVLRVAGILVALGVLASAAAFSAGARSTEVRLLAARGTGPGGAGAKAALEAVFPSVAGGAIGLALAFVFVSAVTGGAEPSGTSIRTAVIAAGVAVIISILALGVVAALTSLRHAGRHHGRLSTLARIPWEILLLGVAAVAAARLPPGLGSTEVALDVTPPSPYLLLFPVAFVAGFAGLGARLFREGFRAVRNRGAVRGRASYLALHRLAGAPLLPVLLVGAAGLCLGVFVHGQALARSLEFTVDAKARLFVGSDAQAWINPESQVPASFPLPMTRASRARQAGTADPGGALFDLVGVDPDTVAEAAFWSDRFADVPLRELMSRLEGSDGGPVPVVVVGEGFAPTALAMNQQVLPVEVVGRATAFPGMLSRRPLVVIDSDAVAEAYPAGTNPLITETATTELWIRGDPDRALAALGDTPIAVFQTLTADRVKDLPRLSVVIDTFAVLDALGLATGVLVIAALLMYLQARQRSQVVAYGLSTRMGIAPVGHRASLLLETGSMLVIAFVLGVGLGLAAAAILVGRLDPLPVVPPDPLLVLPVPAVAACLVAVVVAAWLGAWITGRQAASARLGEVMRVAE